MSEKHDIILAEDTGGTKSEMLAVDLETCEVLARVRHTVSELPESVTNSYAPAGHGRSIAMRLIGAREILQQIKARELHYIANLICAPEILSYLHAHCEKLAVYETLLETAGALQAENLTSGIVIVAGTGTTGTVFGKDGSLFNFDGDGPICGDWGGAYTVGRRFLRNTFRAQNFSEVLIPEMATLLEHFRGFPDFKFQAVQPGLPINTVSYHKIIFFLLVNQDRSLVASVSKVCDDCARHGSAIAADVLAQGGRELAESVTLAAAFKGLTEEPGLPVVASGSVLKSDAVYEAMKAELSSSLPSASLIRSCRSQLEGQVNYLLRKLTPGNSAGIERFHTAMRRGTTK